MKRAVSLIVGVGLGLTVQEDTATESTVAGVTQVSQTCIAELVEELRIGTIDGPGTHTFGQIQDLSVAPDGSIFVADLHPQSVRQYDPAGRFVRQIGREGEGPGEYRSLLGIEVLSGGNLAVWDLGNRRISIYDGEGDFLRGIPVYEGVFANEAFGVDPEGRFYVKIHTEAPTLLSNGRFGDFNFGYLRVSASGTIVDTLRLPPENPTGAFQLLAASGALRPFPVQEVYALGRRGGLVTGMNDSYSFTIQGEAGAVVVENESYRPVSVAGNERREWEALREYFERETGGSFPVTPRIKPAFRDLWVDADGRVWVRRYVEAVKRDLPSGQRTRSGRLRPNITWREPQVFDVYSSDGHNVGCVELPRSARLSESRGSVVWAVVLGSLDEEYVVRWKVPGLGRD